MMRAGYVYGLNDECLVIYVLCMIEMLCALWFVFSGRYGAQAG